MNRMKWKLEFYDRYCRHEAELTRLYRELYHNDMAAFERFTDMLYDAYTARPESLKLMDRAAGDIGRSGFRGEIVLNGPAFEIQRAAVYHNGAQCSAADVDGRIGG